jgi:hypothetical protein
MINCGNGIRAGGFVGKELVSVGGLLIMNQAIQIPTQLPKHFMHCTMNGVLGLGFGIRNNIYSSHGVNTSHRTLIDTAASQADIPLEAKLFTLALSSGKRNSKESFFTLGWIDQELVKASGHEISWTPVDSKEGFWMFDSDKATINGKTTSRPENKAVADTGTALTLVSDDVCDALYGQIPGATYSKEHQGYIIPRGIKVEQLPEFRLAVGNKEFVLQKEDLVFAQADANF